MKADILTIRPDFPPEILNGRRLSWLQLGGQLAAERTGVMHARRVSENQLEVWIEAEQLDGNRRRFPMRIAAYEALESVNGVFRIAKVV